MRPTPVMRYSERAAPAVPTRHADAVLAAPLDPALNRMDHIDGLRAAACLAVFLMHCWMHAGQPQLRVPFPGHPINPLPAARSLVLHALLLHGLSPSAFQDINGVFWSLSLEWQLYFTFPLLAWAFHRRGAAATVAAVAAVNVVYRVAAYRIWGTHDVP